METNPYQPPAHEPVIEEVIADPDERLRTELIMRESQIRMIAMIVLGFSVCGFVLFSTLTLPVLAAFLLFAFGMGLRYFQPWARWGMTILLVPCLLLIPIGTVLGGIALHALWGKEGRAIFTPEYRAVIPKTKHIKCPGTYLVWLVCSTFLLLGFCALAISFFGKI